MDRRTFLGAAASAAALVGVAGCTSAPGSGEEEGSQASPTPTSTATPTATGTSTATSGGGKTIEMVTADGDYYFDPIGLFVESGETVTWTVAAGSHSSTAYETGNSSATVTRIPDGATAWNSSILTEQGATFDHEFTTAGTYDYFCIPHKSLGMVGRIVVGEPGGPAEGSMPPDGDVPTSETIVDRNAVSYDEFTG